MGMFQALGAILAPRLVRWRWAIIAVWMLVLVVTGTAASGLSKLITEDHGASSYPSARADAILKDRFGLNAVTELALIFEREPGVPDAAFTAFEQKATDLAAAVPQVDTVRAIPLDGHRELALQHVKLRAELDDPAAVEAVKAIKSELASLTPPAGAAVHLMGRPVIMEELAALNKSEVGRIERISLFVSLLVLLFVFGSLVAAALPVLVGMAGIVTTLGTLALLGGAVPVVEMTRLVTSIIAVAVGIDYALFMVSRYREERAKGHGVEVAIGEMLGHTGEAIVFSGLVMAVSVLALVIPDYTSTRAIAVAIALVVVISLIASYTLLPALLVVLDRHLEWPRALARLRWGSRSAFWTRFSDWVVRRYRPILAASVLFVLVLLGQLGHLKLWEPSPSLLPHFLSSRQGYDALARNGLDGELDAFYLVIHQPKGPHVLAPETVEAMAAAKAALVADSRVRRVDSLLRPGVPVTDQVRLFAQLDNPLLGPILRARMAVALRADETGTDVVMRIVPTVGLASPNLRELVLDLEHRVLPALPHPGGLRMDLGGNVPRRVDFTQEVYGKTVWVVLVAVLAVYLLLLAYFRSVLLPLKAVLMNAIPVLGGCAVLVLVLQDGVGAGLLGISEPPGALMAMTPLMLFCMVFGLGMDYEVLILSRIREAHRRGLPDDAAIAEGMAKTGGVVTGAALIMLSVFVPNLFSALLSAKELGLGLTAAVLLDATVVRLLLVPTLMRGMGKWNWYFPGRKEAPAEPERQSA